MTCQCSKVQGHVGICGHLITSGSVQKKKNKKEVRRKAELGCCVRTQTFLLSVWILLSWFRDHFLDSFENTDLHHTLREHFHKCNKRCVFMKNCPTHITHIVISLTLRSFAFLLCLGVGLLSNCRHVAATDQCRSIFRSSAELISFRGSLAQNLWEEAYSLWAQINRLPIHSG